jgi:hypothetical protein
MELDLFLRGKTSAANLSSENHQPVSLPLETEDGRLKPVLSKAEGIEDQSSILILLQRDSAKPCGTADKERYEALNPPMMKNE